VVICDDVKNSSYVKDYKNIYLIDINRDFYYNKPGRGGSPYNEYLNHALNMMDPDDYFMILDDDDFYTSTHELKNI